MPSKNMIRQFQPNSYLHIYNRGINKQTIFHDRQDNLIFLSIFDRYLNPASQQVNSDGNGYECFSSEIELQAYCLMGNHYHLLMHAGENPQAVSELMKVISASYTLYSNKKYDRVGPLFQSRFKSSPIEDEEQLLHVSRYIHLNPQDPLNYEFSSVNTILGPVRYPWLNCERLKSAIGNLNYLDFLSQSVA